MFNSQVIYESALPILQRTRKVLLNPIFIFVVLQIVSITLTVLWVLWFSKQTTIHVVAARDVAFLIAGCVLSGIILLGTVMLFIFGIKQSRLNVQQRSFVSSVTHELRSPIASMQLSIDTISSQNLTPEIIRKLLTMLGSDLERLVHLVDRILVSARLDRGIQIFTQNEIVNLSEAIRSSISHASHLDPGLADRVEVTCADSLTLNSPKPALLLVINNLLENAVKYSPKGAKIEIRAWRENKWVYICVTDLGFGLEPSERKRIFKIFTRGKIASRLAIPGTGLGLHIVRSVVKILGGKVWAESQGRGLGSSFFVKLPDHLDRHVEMKAP